MGISESGLAKSASLVSVRQLGGCEICSQGPGISDMLSESYTSHVVTATHQGSMLIWRREINRVVDLLMKQIKHWNYLKLVSLASGLLGCRGSYLAILGSDNLWKISKPALSGSSNLNVANREKHYPYHYRL